VKQDLLITMHRHLQGLVDFVHLRPLAQITFRRLTSGRYKEGRLARARQNGRVWMLDLSVALRGEEQEPETIEWLRRVLVSGATAIDVGANVGQMTLEMAALVGKGGTVVAIEPGPGNVRCLRRHIAGNAMEDRVRVIEAACMDIDGGEVVLRTFTGSGNPGEVASGHAVLGRESHEGTKRTDVAVSRVSIDGVAQRLNLIPAAIKIDVEGSELAVLAGAKKTLSVYKPALRVAFHPFAFDSPLEASEQLRQLLREAGYYIQSDPGSALSLDEYVAVPTSA